MESLLLFLKKITAFLDSLASVESRNDIPEWMQLLLKSFKLLSSDFANANEDILIKVNQLDMRIEALESELAISKAITEALQIDRDAQSIKLNSLEVQLEDSLNHSRRNCLLIHGVDEDNKENTDEKVLKLFNDSLKIKINIKDIDRSHRIGKKQLEFGRQTRTSRKKVSRPIIVKFVSYRDRKEIFSNKKHLKGQFVSISESLTKKRYDLYKKCMDSYGKKNVWSLDGRIFCKDENDEVLVVTCDGDLAWYGKLFSSVMFHVYSCSYICFFPFFLCIENCVFVSGQYFIFSLY